MGKSEYECKVVGKNEERVGAGEGGWRNDGRGGDHIPDAKTELATPPTPSNPHPTHLNFKESKQ